MPDRALLSFEDVSFTINAKPLLSGLSFELPSSGLIAISGPNGAGKSLTLRLMAGLLEPSAGLITRSPDLRPSLVFQKPVFLRRSVKANLDHALNIAQTGIHVDHLLTIANLADQAQQPARSLSGGEQQRLAFARALAAKPNLLMLDEPTAALDPDASRDLAALIQATKDQGQCLIVLVSHDQGLVEQLADQVWTMEKGHLV